MTGWPLGLIFKAITLFATIGIGLPAAQAEAHTVPGERARMVCASCHGANGQSVAPEIPNLAGQSANYLAAQLYAFKRGQRKSSVMIPLAMPLSDADIQAVATYYESQPVVSGTADPKLVKRGQQLYRGGDHETGLPACMACHSPNGIGNPAAGYPALSGQHATYIKKQLAAYKSGERNGGRAGVMTTIAARLTEADAEAVAGYLQGLH